MEGYVFPFLPTWEEVEGSKSDEELRRPLWGYIDSVSPRGVMVISFNASMYTSFNSSLINSANTDIYIDPSLSRKKADNFTIKSVNLTWEA